jgi:hypothetical protein
MVPTNANMPASLARMIIEDIEAPALRVSADLGQLPKLTRTAQTNLIDLIDALMAASKEPSTVAPTKYVEAAIAALGTSSSGLTQLHTNGEALASEVSAFATGLEAVSVDAPSANLENAKAQARSGSDRIAALNQDVSELINAVQVLTNDLGSINLGSPLPVTNPLDGAGDSSAAISTELNALESAIDSIHADLSAAWDSVTRVLGNRSVAGVHGEVLWPTATGLREALPALDLLDDTRTGIALYVEAADTHLESASRIPSQGGDTGASLAEARAAAERTIATFEAINSIANESLARLEVAKEALASISHGNTPRGARSVREHVLPAAVTSLTNSIYATSDFVTDIQVSEVVAYEVQDTLYQTSIPPYVGTGPLELPSQAWLALQTISSLHAQANAAIQSVGGIVDGVIVQTEPLIPVKGNKCRVEEANGVHVYYGTTGSDTCTGTAGLDIFWMLSGGDTAYGRGYKDHLHMGAGGDGAHGEQGPDWIWGGNGSDNLWGGYGNDNIEDKKEHTNDSDNVYGGPGFDDGSIYDRDEKDYWRGGAGEDPEPSYDIRPHGQVGDEEITWTMDDVRRDSDP